MHQKEAVHVSSPLFMHTFQRKIFHRANDINFEVYWKSADSGIPGRAQFLRVHLHYGKDGPGVKVPLPSFSVKDVFLER